eukprot:GEZU01002606.1.p1 GENE.GEZU01002606.1~~GEZU01002606.1.p1  ORF type:complete len:298 (-),score=69.64 GEZU01002606.1:54-845(-)
MNEIDTVLTDWLLAIECVVFIWRLCRTNQKRSIIGFWFFVALFFATCLGSLMGGISHAFFTTNGGLEWDGSFGYMLTWRTAMIAIGLASLSLWMIALYVLEYNLLKLPRKLVVIAKTLLWVEFVAYSAMILFYSDDFIGAALNYVTALVFLTLVFVVFLILRSKTPSTWVAIISIAVSYCAIFAQAFRIEIHPHYCSYNATYHIIQGVGLFLFYKGMKGVLIESSSTPTAHDMHMQKMAMRNGKYQYQHHNNDAIQNQKAKAQ